MKRITLLITILALTANLCTNAQQRQQVTQSEILIIAQRLLADSSEHSERTIQNIQVAEKRDSIGNVILYEVTADSISILLSGSRACCPLLGEFHTLNGSLLDNYDNLPDNLRWLIDGYIAQIVPCFSNDTIRMYYNDEWNNLIEGTNLSNRDIEERVLDFTSKWAQTGCNINDNNNPLIGYEYYMPPDANNSCIHSSVGCCAVAMGQVLNYWKHPTSPDWNETYDWCNMSDILDVTSPNFLKNREAIALLLRDCAYPITNSNQFGCDGTWSDMTQIPSALTNNFKYSSDAHFEQRSAHQDDWNTLVKEQIDQGRPIIYGGGGHTFVCHGYHDDNQGGFYLMLNMGNGYIGNGWHYLNDITFYHPIHEVYYNFTSNQSAIFDIYPDNQTILCDRNVVLDDYYTQYLDDNINSWDILPVTVTNLTSASITSNANWRTIPSGATTTYRAQESITLRDGFMVERGADFAAIIVPCDNCGNPPVILPAERTGRQQTEQPTEGPLEGAKGKPLHFTAQREQAPTFTLTPNPAHNSVTVTINSQLSILNSQLSLTLSDAAGRELLNTKVSTHNFQLSISQYPAGTYFLTLRTPDATSTQRLVIE